MARGRIIEEREVEETVVKFPRRHVMKRSHTSIGRNYVQVVAESYGDSSGTCTSSAPRTAYGDDSLLTRRIEMSGRNTATERNCNRSCNYIWNNIYGNLRVRQFFSALIVTIYTLSTTIFVYAQITTCSDGSQGYDNLQSLQTGMEAAANEVSSGSPPESMYLFRLCPGSRFIFQPGQSLTPQLDGTVFQCGDGLSTDNCRFEGGNNQVQINPSTIPGVTIRDVRFQGIEFTDFSNSAISGNADSNTKVTLEDTVFNDFNSRYAILQQGSGGGTPFEVNIFDSTFQNAQGGDIFSNDGGSLVIQDTTLVDSDVMTIGAVSNSGVIMIMDSEFTGGNVEV